MAGGVVVKLYTASGEHFVYIQSNSMSVLTQPPALSDAQLLPLQRTTAPSSFPSMPPMQPMEPMKMGDMQMSLNPMTMRMGNMSMHMGTVDAPATARRFCSQCGVSTQPNDRFCSSCGHQLTS
jgi:hypothetical protein